MHRQQRPFATVLQAALIMLLGISLVLIAQQFSMAIYQIGLIVLGVSTITQIGFGNVLPRSNFAQSIKYWILTYVIVGGLFVLGILLVPTFLSLIRG